MVALVLVQILFFELSFFKPVSYTCGRDVCRRYGYTEFEHPTSEFLPSVTLPISLAFTVFWLHLSGLLASSFLFPRPENLGFFPCMPPVVLTHTTWTALSHRRKATELGMFLCGFPSHFPQKTGTACRSLSASFHLPVLSVVAFCVMFRFHNCSLQRGGACLILFQSKRPRNRVFFLG